MLLQVARISLRGITNPPPFRGLTTQKTAEREIGATKNGRPFTDGSDPVGATVRSSGPVERGFWSGEKWYPLVNDHIAIAGISPFLMKVHLQSGSMFQPAMLDHRSVIACDESKVPIWAALIVMSSHEQPGWPFSLLNDEQMVATGWGLSTNQLCFLGPLLLWFTLSYESVCCWKDVFLCLIHLNPWEPRTFIFSDYFTHMFSP